MLELNDKGMIMKNSTGLFLLLAALWACDGKDSRKNLNVIWAERGGGSSADRGEGIALDGPGNSYVTGAFSGTAKFGNYPLKCSGADSEDIFIVKYDRKGKVLWAKRAGGPNADEGRAIAATRQGAISVTGSFKDTADFDSVTANSAGREDIFVAQYGSSGRGRWIKSAGGAASDAGLSIATDTSGNSLVTGFFSGVARFGGDAANPITLTGAGETDIFIAKYDTTGKLLWAKRAGGAAADTGKGLAVDQAGNAYLTGVFAGAASFGAKTLTSSGPADIFIAKYDQAGQLLWIDQAGGSSHDGGAGVAVDAAANCYVTGTMADTVRFDGETMRNSNEGDVFLAKYDSAGALLWSKRAGGPANDHAESVAVDAMGTSYVTGVFSGTASFGPDTLKSAAGSDIFLARYDEDGNLLWASQGGEKGMKEAARIAVHKSSRVILTTGRFSGETIFGTKPLTSAGAADVFATAAVAAGAPPTALWASPRLTSILLTWKDNADDEIGFSIRRKKAGDTTWTELRDPGRNARHYLDFNLLPNTPYTYTVRAKYPAGPLSSFSIIETATDSLPSLEQHTKGLEIDNAGGGAGGWSRFRAFDADQLFRGHLQIWTVGARGDTARSDTVVVYDGDDKNFKSHTKIKLYGRSAAAAAVGSADENTAAAKPYLPVIMKCQQDSLEIRQFTYQNDQNWILAEWNVHNLGARAKPVKLALYLDVDAGGNLSNHNKGNFDARRKLVYLYNPSSQNYVGMALVRDSSYFENYQISAFHDLRTPDNGAGGELARKNLFAGNRQNINKLVDEETYDLTMTLVSNLKNLAPGAGVKVMYAIAAARSQTDLERMIDQARDFAPCATPYFWADVNGDGSVDTKDVHAVASHWNTRRGEPRYNPRADVTVDPNNPNRRCGDGIIDILDLQLVANQVPKSM